ncbi:hypothetical protein ABW19_dt0209884 [Dactylella cylindrospora]|nr:hypothetical protein ABW19_dt0209884 [Dactylella cylindrospora]
MDNQKSQEHPGMSQLGGDLDELLARLEIEEQQIQERKAEIVSKKLEATNLGPTDEQGTSNPRPRDLDQQGGLPPVQNNFGSRAFQAFQAPQYETRLGALGGVPESPHHRGSALESDDSFIQDQINKHTFTQAVDPEFYPDDAGAQPIPLDHAANTGIFRPPPPRGPGYPGGSIWNEPKPRVPAPGGPVQLPSIPYWQAPIGQGYEGRPIPELDQQGPDWKAVGSDPQRRGNQVTSPNSFQMSPNRQGFSPSPLSPPFVPSGVTPSWSSGSQTGPSATLSSLPGSGYGNMTYPMYPPPAGHSEFRGNPNNWKPASNSSQAAPMGQNLYGNPGEPPNWKRLMERGVACDWGFLVDRVVLHNDQGASVFLQHKLKDFDHPEHKTEIMDAIVDKALALMMNRFGNFLVQRVFEHGEQYHIDAIMKVIKGRVVQLSMDAFGCHVIQRALDTVTEPFKIMIIQELLHRIPETVMHRYACHVWQKLFEVRWVGTPPQVMKYMNEALAGMWPEIAMGETGSLVVQNIFENCLEEDKRPCVNEVLSNLDVIARGQFGNWCIQHIW